MWNKFLIILFLSGLIVSCKTTQKIAEKPIAENPSMTVKKQQQQITTINATRVNFSIPLQNQNNAFRGSIKAIIDSSMQVSVQAIFGIEVLRIHLTQDSIVVIDRINQQYVAESFGSINANALLSYEMIQGLLLNRIVDPSNSKDFTNFSHSKQSDAYIVSYENSTFVLTYLLNPAYRIARTSVSDKEQKNYILAEYSTFESVNSLFYPRNNQIKMLFADKQFSIDYAIERVDFNQTLDIKISIPTRYKLVSWEEVSKMLL